MLIDSEMARALTGREEADMGQIGAVMGIPQASAADDFAKIYDILDRYSSELVAAMQREEEAKAEARRFKAVSQQLGAALERSSVLVGRKDARIARLCDENERMRALLASHGIEVS